MLGSCIMQALTFICRPKNNNNYNACVCLCDSHHQLATSKGSLCGDLSYLEEDGSRVNCFSSSAVRSNTSHEPYLKAYPTRP